jgi:hypothetical protein
MQDIIIGGIFLVVFGIFVKFIYRVIGDDADKVHGCCAGGMAIEEKEKIESQP